MYLITIIDKRIGKCMWEFLYSGILRLNPQKGKSYVKFMTILLNKNQCQANYLIVKRLK